MEDVVVKFPADFIIDDNKRELIYQNFEVPKSQEQTYQKMADIIKLIFNVNDSKDVLEDISLRIHKFVELCKNQPGAINIINKAQWILKFAHQEDIDYLLSTSKFKPHYIEMAVPVDAYIDDRYQKVFYDDVKIPEWQKEYAVNSAYLIEWLVYDDANSFEEKIDSILLSTDSFKRQVLIDNAWLLMYLSDAKRKQVMLQLEIPMEDISITSNYHEDATNPIVTKRVMVPKMVHDELLDFSYELEYALKYDVSVKPEASIPICCAESIGHGKHNYYVLAYNKWVYDFMTDESRKTIMRGLQIDNSMKEELVTPSKHEEIIPTLPTKRILSIIPRKSLDNFHGVQIWVPTAEFEEYSILNKRLLSIFLSNLGNVDEQEIVDFINSDARVTQAWPWIILYVKNLKDQIKSEQSEEKAEEYIEDHSSRTKAIFINIEPREIQNHKVKKPFKGTSFTVPMAEYDDYRYLVDRFRKLFSHFGQDLDQKELVDFIKCDERVLLKWPWLLELVEDDDFREQFSKLPLETEVVVEPTGLEAFSDRIKEEVINQYQARHHHIRKKS